VPLTSRSHSSQTRPRSVPSHECPTTALHWGPPPKDRWRQAGFTQTSQISQTTQTTQTTQIYPNLPKLYPNRFGKFGGLGLGMVWVGMVGYPNFGLGRFAYGLGRFGYTQNPKLPKPTHLPKPPKSTQTYRNLPKLCPNRFGKFGGLGLGKFGVDIQTYPNIPKPTYLTPPDSTQTSKLPRLTQTLPKLYPNRLRG
jgi:hypothetical protein